MDTIFVLNVGKQVIDIFSNNGSSPSSPFFDDKYTSELDTGAESFEFTTFANTRTSVTLEVGNYILFKYDGKYKLFQITETEDEHTEGEKLLTVYAEMAGMELLNDYCEPFTLEGNFITFMNRLLQDTNWVVGRYSANLLNDIQMVEVKEYTNVYKLIQSNLSTFGGVEIEFRVEFVGNTLVGQYIDCYTSGERGNKTYRRFEYGEDIKGIIRNRNINDLATAVIGVGKDNLTFKDIEWSKNLGKPCDKPLQQDFVVDIEANDIWNNNGKYIKTVFKCDAEDAEDLLQQSWDHLQEIKNPKFDYDVDLALTIEDYEDIRIGDTNYVVDFSYNPPILLEARVSKLEISLSDPRSNKCTLSNYKELVSMLTQPVDQSMVDSMIQSKFPIGGEDIAMGAIGEGHISVTYYKAIKADIMSAALAEVEILIADKADITDLTALNADIENLRATKADIIDLTATNGKITNLESDLADVKTLVNGNLTSDNIQALHLTAENTTIDNALIKNAMIDTVSANKINTGTLNTNNVIIESEDGGIVLSGSTQQFKDENGQVRVQIGKDAQGNFTFCLFSQDGKGILLDETGIKAGAVPNGLIVNDMVDDNANIAGSKLDIASVITEINGNTETIKSSVIKFDDTGQSLLVAFNTLKNKVETIEDVSIEGDLSSVMEQVNTNTTQIGVIQGEITSLINNTTITKEDGVTVQLKDEYSATKQTVDEISTKIGYLETNYKKTLKSSSVQYYLSTSKTSLDGGSWEDTAPEWSQDKYMWQRMKYTYTDGSTTYGTASCVAGAKGDTGEQGPQGIQGDTGPQGIQGPAGNDGKTYYTWIKYADSSTGSGMSNDPTGKTYIGFAYNKTTPTESNTASDYTWSLIKGDKGDTGIQGPAGSDGKTTYTWIKYSDNADGTGLYDTPKSTTKYIGIATNKTTATESTTKTDYAWSLFKGDTGEQGPKGDKGATGEKGQSLTSSTPQWYLSTSNTTQTGGSWQDTMPQVATGKYIWQRFKNVWANPTATTYTTPVLEQIDEAVKEVISKQAEFKKTLDSISATVSENTSSLEGVSATVAQHTTDLRGVTSKISTLETNSAGLTSRLQSAENKLTKDGITNIVGDYYADGDTTRNALSRIEQKADSVTTTVSNMKIGGTNLILNTQFEGAVAGTRTLPKWLITESCVIYSKYGQSGYNKMNTMYLGNDNANSDGTKNGYMYQTLTSERFQKNTEYTLSLDLSAENNVKGWEVVIRYYDANSNMIAEQILFDDTTDNAGHLECTFTSKNLDANMVQFCIGHKGSNNGANGYLLMVGNIMLEKGNIANGWQPSPQDMASKSIVTQTANDVRYEFKHTSGENLIYNGDARGAGNAWTDNSGGQGTFGRYISDNLGKNFYKSTSGYGFTHDWIKLENNTEYYYSARIASDCDYNSDNSSTFEPMHCWCNNTDSSGQAGMIVLDYNQKIVKDKWVYCYIHFKTTGDSGIKFKPFIYAPGITGSYIGATDIMLYKGSMWKSYSPNPNEVLSNTTIINKDGVTVKHTSGTSTNLNSTALNFYNSSNKLYAQVDGGQYKFWYGDSYIGYLGHNGWVEDNSRRNVALCCEPDSFIALGAKQSSSNGSSYPIYLVATGNDKTISSTKYNHGVTIIRPHMNGVMKLYSKADNTDTYPAQIFNNNGGQLILQGDNITDLCISNGSSICVGFRVTEDNSQSNNAALGAYGPLNMNGYPLSNAQVVNSASATSAQTYALRTLSDEESYSDPTRKTITHMYMSQTLTEGEIKWSDRETHFTSEVENGVYECYIEIPWWIAQNLENNYHVNITCTNGFYQYYVSERDPYYFIVRSDKDSMGFTFEIVGKLLDNNTTANNANIAGAQYLTVEPKQDVIPVEIQDDSIN